MKEQWKILKKKNEKRQYLCKVQKLSFLHSPGKNLLVFEKKAIYNTKRFKNIRGIKILNCEGEENGKEKWKRKKEKNNRYGMSDPDPVVYRDTGFCLQYI